MFREEYTGCVLSFEFLVAGSISLFSLAFFVCGYIFCPFPPLENRAASTFPVFATLIFHNENCCCSLFSEDIKIKSAQKTTA